MTYKNLVENAVDLSIYRKLSNVEEIKYFDTKKVEVYKIDNDVFFKVNVDVVTSIIPLPFTICGYVDDYCRPVVTHIDYERKVCVRKENGEFAEPKTNHYSVYGDEIDTFKYNK